MNLDWHENWRGTGQRETLSGSSGLGDVDALSSDIGSPDRWGVQCYKATVVAATDSYGYTTTGDTDHVRFRLEFHLSDVTGFDVGEFFNVLDLLHSLTDAIAILYILYESSGPNVFKAQTFIYHDGSANLVNDSTISVGTTYRWELLWDTAADVWRLFFGGSSVANGTITSTPQSTPWHLNDVLIGPVGVLSTGAGTLYVGPCTRANSAGNLVNGPIDRAPYPASCMGRNFQKVGGGLI